MYTIDMRESFVRSIARAENGSVIFLEPKESELVVPIIIRKSEEESILIGMSNLSSSRPSPHDLFVSLLKKNSFRLIKAEIHDYKDELFYARLIVRVNRRKSHSLDARPSDVIAIAVRLGVPIYVSNKIIRDTAISTNVMYYEKKNSKVRIDYNESRVDKLESSLQKAVELENYEEAARIRDKIQKLQ